MIGTRGHDLGGKMTALELATLAKEKGLDSIQLVLYRSIQGVEEDFGFLSSCFARKIGSGFIKSDVRIALLGCYINLPHVNLNRFKEYLKYAKDFNCPIVGTETGSVNEDYSFNTKNHSEEAYEQVVDIFKELTNEAAHYGVFVGIEGVYKHIIHDIYKMKGLLDEVNSPNLQVIFDPVNYLHMDNYKDVKHIIEEAFRLFGDKIAIIHAKDFIIEDNVIKSAPIGQGLMDYEHLYKTIRKYKYNIDVIIEEYTGKDLDESINYLKTLEDILL